MIYRRRVPPASDRLLDGVAGSARAAVAALEAWLAGASFWHVVLLAAAARERFRAGPPAVAADAAIRALMLVPAHDEEQVIGGTLLALGQLRPAPSAVVVVADHCTDQTVELARIAGARVLERDSGERGKGAALAWALAELAPDIARFDAVVFVDADCQPTPNLLTAVAERLAEGHDVVQVDYVVANPEAGTAAALRDAAFRLRNTIRPAGQYALGLSAGLLGTGMAFTPEALRRRPWQAKSLIEDAEQHLALVAAGERVAFTTAAAVRSPMPATLEESADQQLRWDSGRPALVRAWAPLLLRQGLRERDRVRLGALGELLLPPQSLQLAGQLAVLVVAPALGMRRTLRLALAGTAAQTVYVAGGLAVGGGDAATYRALLRAPLLVWQKLSLTARLVLRRGPSTFVRTARADDAGGEPRA